MGLEQTEPFIAEGECIRTRYLNGVINIPCLHLLDGIFQQSFSLMCKALELERERCVFVGSEGFIWIGGKVSVLLQREV